MTQLVDRDDALEALEAGAPAMIARVEAWSAVNSGSLEPQGLARMATLIEDALADLPGETSRVPLPPTLRWRPDGQGVPVEHGDALRLSVRPNAPLQIALTGHFDTVFPAASPFQSPRRRADGSLHGPGVADMKGGIVVMLAALKAFEATADSNNIGYEVLLSPDEEIGSPASAPYLAELGARSRLGLVYEPALADGRMVDARKGSGNFTLLVRGRAAHVGRAFADGRNAVVAAAIAAERLDALNGQRDGVTVNIGSIDGGGPTNQVPEFAAVRFNVRAPDASAADWALDAVRGALAVLERRDGIVARLEGVFGRPAKPLTPPLQTMTRWAQAAAGDLGIALSFGPSGGVCEGNNLAAAGCPAIDTLGPCGGGLHTDEEFAVMASFPERAKLSFLLLHGLAQGRFDVRDLAA